MVHSPFCADDEAPLCVPIKMERHCLCLYIMECRCVYIYKDGAPLSMPIYNGASLCAYKDGAVVVLQMGSRSRVWQPAAPLHQIRHQLKQFPQL